MLSRDESQKTGLAADTLPASNTVATDMNVLVVDIGGSSVKLHTPDGHSSNFVTPVSMDPQRMMECIDRACSATGFDHVSIGYPGPVHNGRLLRDPVNLGKGWTGYDFEAAFDCPVRIINDAALQALGSYQGGIMLFLGLGTGLGTTLIHDGHIVPMELAHLPFMEHRTFEQLLGTRALEACGTELWKIHVARAIDIFMYTLCPEYIVLGGGNARLFADDELPDHTMHGNNENARAGGIRLWEPTYACYGTAKPEN